MSFSQLMRMEGDLEDLSLFLKSETFQVSLRCQFKTIRK